MYLLPDWQNNLEIADAVLNADSDKLFVFYVNLMNILFYLLLFLKITSVRAKMPCSFLSLQNCTLLKNNMLPSYLKIICYLVSSTVFFFLNSPSGILFNLSLFIRVQTFFKDIYVVHKIILVHHLYAFNTTIYTILLKTTWAEAGAAF